MEAISRLLSWRRPLGSSTGNHLRSRYSDSGELLVAGSKSNPDSEARIPFTGIFGSDGNLRKELILPDDNDLQKMTESGDPRVSGPGHPLQNRPVELGQAEAADDGNIYMMRRISPAILYAISPAGEIVKRFKVGPDHSDYTPISVHIAKRRITILFRLASQHKDILEVVDLDGHELGAYEDPPRDGHSTFGLALACYSDDPERFTFLGTDTDGFLQFKIAEPR